MAALFLADQGDVERAIEVQTLAWSFPVVANSRWCDDVAGQHLITIARTLSPNVVAAAQARGRRRNLWITIEELLAVFSEDESDGAS